MGVNMTVCVRLPVNISGYSECACVGLSGCVCMGECV